MSLIRTPWYVVAGTAVFAVFAVLTVTVAAQSQPAAESRFADHLLNGNLKQQSDALAAVKRMSADRIGPELRAALAKLLARGNATVQQSRTANFPSDVAIDPEFHARVCETVANLRDPSHLQLLADSLGTCGWQVQRALADFGEAAAGPVLAVVMSPSSYYEAVNEGLITLRFMAEDAESPTKGLSAATRTRLIAAARHHLSRAGEPAGTGTTLRWAIDLAGVLRAPELLEILNDLATDPDAVAARGIGDLQLVERTQKRALDALAGIPPNPRR